MSWADAADARDDVTSSGSRSGFSFDLRLSGGGASAEFTESGYPVADFEALTIGGSARFGWFIGPHILLGAEITGSWHVGVGTLRVHDPSYFNRGLPRAATYSATLPLGVFVEVYPAIDAGWFLGVAGNVGFIDLPEFSQADSTAYTSGYSLDAGYELSGTDKHGPAIFVRYSRWAGEEFSLSSEHPDGLVSRELMLGVRWSFWTPSWG